MFGFDYTQIAAVALIAVGGIGALWSNRQTLAGLLPKSIGFGGGDVDTLDFQAHNRLQKRFERLKCKEALDACVTQLQHFYHDEGSH